MKNVIYLLIAFCLISCSENGDKYIGIYVIDGNASNFVQIKKAGDDGYYITISEGYDKNTKYCVFKNGCFLVVNRNGEFPIMCHNNNQNLIDNKGSTLIKAIIKS